MSEIAFNKTVVLIISLVVLITLIVYFYYLYSPYKKSSEEFSNYTNESMNEFSLRMECINKNIFSIQEKIKEKLIQDKQCDDFDTASCYDIFTENNIPYYNCTAYCYKRSKDSSGPTKLMCPVKYNCRDNSVQIGLCQVIIQQS